MNIPKIKNITSKAGNATPNQFIITESGRAIFQSYNSIISVIDYAECKITIGKDWNFSQTTGKYRNIFFDDQGFADLATLAGLRKAIKTGQTINGFSLEYNPELR